MKNILVITLCAPILASSCATDATRPPAGQPCSELLVCGWDEVYCLDFAKLDAKGAPSKVWSWKAADCKTLPEFFKKKFATTDECKPFDNGKKVLVTSSAWAEAYNDRETGDALFHAEVPNAHSADLLPNGRVAVASSFDRTKNGDRLIVYDLDTPNKPLLHEELYGAHGVVWDEKRQLLWGLSYTDLRVFKLVDWETDEPKLEKLENIPLPEGAGHDMYPVPDSSDMFVTTGRHVWLFDRDTKEFRKHPKLGDVDNVKCVNINPDTGRTVYVKADLPDWWSGKIRFLDPDEVLNYPGGHIYKTRWNKQIK